VDLLPLPVPMFVKRIKHWVIAALGFDANMVVPGLFIGSYSSTTDLAALKKNNITHILTILQNPPPNKFPDDFTYKVINAVDDETTNMLDYLETALDFIDQARAHGGSVLVHCHAGMSRSGSIGIALVMRDQQLSFKDAWAFVAEGRSIVRPIEHFRKQLQLYEKMGYKVDKNNSEYIEFWRQHEAAKAEAEQKRELCEASLQSSADSTTSLVSAETKTPTQQGALTPASSDSSKPLSLPDTSTSSPLPESSTGSESTSSSTSASPPSSPPSPSPAISSSMSSSSSEHDRAESSCDATPQGSLTESSSFPVVVH